MRNDIKIIYNNVEDICKKIIDIVNNCIDYYTRNSYKNSDDELAVTLTTTFIYIFCKDGLYVDCFLYEWGEDDLHTLKDVIQFEGYNNIDTVIIYNSQSNEFVTNNNNLEISDIIKINENGVKSVNVDKIRDMFSNRINRDLSISLEQGFTSDMVNNLKNWNYNDE